MKKIDLVDIDSPNDRQYVAINNKIKKRHPIRTAVIITFIVLIIVFVAIYGIMYSCSVKMQDAFDDAMKVNGFDNTDTILVELYDSDKIKISYCGMKESIYGIELKFLIQNDSDVKQLFGIDELSIDGFAVTYLFSADVPAGAKSYSNVTVAQSSLDNNKLDVNSISTAKLRFVNHPDGNYLSNKKSDVIFFNLTSSTVSSDLLKDNSVTASSNSLVGVWNSRSNQGVSYTFYEDGSGQYDLMGNIMKIKYTVKDSKITIEFLEEGMGSVTLNYSLDGDTLNIKDSFGNDTLYSRQR